jgi:hypothetical protein
MAVAHSSSHAPSWRNLQGLLPVVSVIALGWMIAKLTLRVVQNTEAAFLRPLAPVSLSGTVIPLLTAYCAGLLFCTFRRVPAGRFGVFTVAFIIRIMIGFILISLLALQAMSRSWPYYISYSAQTYCSQRFSMLHLAAFCLS